MEWLRVVLAKMQGLFGRKRAERELDDEFAAHLDLLIEENLRRGMSPEEARFAARRSFGGVEQTKELYRERRGLPILDTLLQDVRFGLRMLRKNPGFTTIAVLTLALGIGANTAIFSVVDAVLLRPLSFHEPNRLAALWQTNPRQHILRGRISPANFLDWQQRNRAFSSMTAILYWSFDYTGAGEPESLLGELVSRDFFALLGVNAERGRTFSAEEYEPGKSHVIVISHGLWQRRFGSAPDIAGRTISLSDQTYTIVGVLPGDFSLPWIGRDREIFAPYAFNNEEKQVRSGGYLQVLGRLNLGVTWQQAQTDLASVAEQLAREYPREDAGVSATVVPLAEQTVGKIRPMLVLLWGAVGFVLLIACANVANLLLARGNTRQRELAVRAALGATRGRLLRQLFIESCLLALLGGAGGLLLARWFERTILLLGKNEIPRLSTVAMDARVFAFAVAAALATALLFGLAPAWQVLRTDLQVTLKECGKTGAASASRHPLRGALVVTEVALALILLSGAGLLLRSFYNVLQVKLGFAPDHLVAMDVFVWKDYPKPEQRAAYVQQAVQNIVSFAGVQSAAASSSPPLLLGGGGAPIAVKILGEAAIRENQKPSALMNIVTPGYFATLGTPLLRGRAFNDLDRRDSAPVALINQTMARRYWSGQDPLGHKIAVPQTSADFGAPPVECEIVGIVGDVRQTGPEREAEAEFYRPFAQDPTGSIAFIARTRSEPVATMKSIQSAIWQANKTVPFYVATTMDDLVASQFQQRYFTLVLLAGFAVLALMLAAIGIYGVISYSTAQRTQEMGVRMALGAQPFHVLRLVIRQGMTYVCSGVIIGLAGSFALKRMVSDLLFGVPAGDPVTFTGVAVLLSLVALVACYIPARRATRVDPITALRYE